MLLYSFSTLIRPLILYISTLRSKVYYSSEVPNPIISTNAKKPERIQREFVSLLYNRFFPQNNGYVNANCLHLLNLRTWHERRLQIDAFFFIKLLLGFRILSVFLGHNLSPSSHSVTSIPSHVYFCLSLKVFPPPGRQIPFF